MTKKDMGASKPSLLTLAVLGIRFGRGQACAHVVSVTGHEEQMANAKGGGDEVHGSVHFALPARLNVCREYACSIPCLVYSASSY